MINPKTILSISVAALAIAVSGPALAKTQKDEPVTTSQPQLKKKTETRSGEKCFQQAPPFMYNPRFMNRGFFKKKCPPDKR